MDPTPLPCFFILGAAKAGSTALHANLGRHPEVFLPTPKEPHFFDVHYARGLEWYRNDALRGHAGEPLVGDATSGYLLLPYVAERIRRHVPDARFIVSLREPVERAYSAWWMQWVRGYEPLPFAEAIDANLAEIEEGAHFDGPRAEAMVWANHTAIRACEVPPYRTYVQSGLYAQQLEAYFEAFPRAAIKVLLFEELVDGDGTLTRALLTFLGADDPAFEGGWRLENPALGRHTAPLLRLLRATRLTRVLRQLPEPWKLKAIERTAWMGRRPALAAGDRARLAAFYEPHNQKLERLLGRDLSAWSRVASATPAEAV